MKLLSEHEVEYLLVGGYAVGYHGYVRSTADMDIWVRRNRENAQRLVAALEAFGFGVAELEPALFLDENRIVRMGVPPNRIEIMTTISDVRFDDGYAARVVERWDDVTVDIIGLDDLKRNKKASGRNKDLSDLDHLE